MGRTDSPLPQFDPVCPMAANPIQIGGKWTAMIVMCLRAGPQRFGVLRRHLRPIEGADDGGIDELSRARESFDETNTAS